MTKIFKKGVRKGPQSSDFDELANRRDDDDDDDDTNNNNTLFCLCALGWLVVPRPPHCWLCWLVGWSVGSSAIWCLHILRVPRYIGVLGSCWCSCSRVQEQTTGGGSRRFCAKWQAQRRLRRSSTNKRALSNGDGSLTR